MWFNKLMMMMMMMMTPFSLIELKKSTKFCKKMLHGKRKGLWFDRLLPPTANYIYARKSGWYTAASRLWNRSRRFEAIRIERWVQMLRGASTVIVWLRSGTNLLTSTQTAMTSSWRRLTSPQTTSPESRSTPSRRLNSTEKTAVR